MPFVCSVPRCSNKRGGHIFPRESGRLQQWLRAMHMESYVPTKHSRVCRNHFTDDDYEMPKDSVIDNPRPILKKDAVPSIFLWNDGNLKRITSKSQIPDRYTSNSVKFHQITNYHFKNKPPDGNLISKKTNEIKVIPIAMKMPKSHKNIVDTVKPPVKRKEFTNFENTKTNDSKRQVTRIPLTVKSQCSDSPLNSIDDMDLVICEKALEYLSSKLKSPTLNMSQSKSHTNIIVTPTLPPDITITSTKAVSTPPSIPFCFVTPEDNVTIKQEPVDETPENALEVEIDYNSSGLVQASVLSQCNLCQCPRLNEQNVITTDQNMKFSRNDKKFCIENLMDINNPAEVQFFTGFKDYEKFKYVYELLGDDVNHLNYNMHIDRVQAHKLRPYEEFLLTIVKLRRNKMFTELGFKFRISKELVEIIFTTWINFLFNKFKEIANWLPKDVIDKYIKYGKGKPCMVIIESESGKSKYSMLSPDKSIKVLIEMTESGNSKYVSEALPGSISDGELIKKATLEAKCNVNRTESQSNVETDSQTDQPYVSNTKKIEKVIGLSKLYTILNGKMDYMLVPLANRIVYVCFMLTNFIKRPMNEPL